ncbi:hypothetical protein C8R27_11439 [Nitrosomonas ureae]|uniref:Uncharacterized protein n=1 Tax=Nitrosomonas ureae TaxID=44577 RepID=A0A286AFY1_9PROT|nr:hypothetical protein [Nitrosomonas ureae]PXX14684.1 hypothetical protein C8R27_11439 [Nitrosomonas ureae]SOD20791.1 hypothetical protein SAMN06297164_2849 [Nitrosomonas ureae]
MDTIRVDICYRPLRIGWIIHSGDYEAFRKAVRLSHTLWGGSFNPILMADREDEAKLLIELFRIDMLWPIGESNEVKEFPKKFPHLINPLFHDSIFIGGNIEQKRNQVLDVQNALEYLRDKPARKAINDKGFRIYNWQVDDPLADIFHIQLGIYPETAVIGIDYREILSQVFEIKEISIDPSSQIPADIQDYPSITYLSRYDLERHYGVQAGRDSPGFFVGDVSDLNDLVCYWNLRAADISLWFVDPAYRWRYTNIIPSWEKAIRNSVSHRHESDRWIALWTRRENFEEARQLFGEMQLAICQVSVHSWNGGNVCPPMMSFDQLSVLGVFGHERGRPKISFALSNKPFCSDTWFHTQHLVASVSFIGGLYGDEQYTLKPPYLPELNEFYARTMHFHYNKLRIESERIGIVIDAADTDAWLYALPVAKLIDRIFDLADYKVKLSNGGLITRQLISRLGGLQGARIFKIPGVRRLLKTYGPATSFTKNVAIQLIKNMDSKDLNAKFSDQLDLHIEKRPAGTQLKADDVFVYMVEKGLFRIGAELTCPSCRMTDWIAVDTLKQSVVCDLCGYKYDATRQLINGELHYRRSGIMGAERNAQGAVPVALTLQQLETTFAEGVYSPSLDFTRKGETSNECEVDFVWVIPRRYPRRTAIILGECKDQGPIKPEEFEKDIENLRRVADALPHKRFKTFVLLAKLNPFTPEEIELTRTLNTEHQLRTILLTARELEPYYIYERTNAEFDIDSYGSSPEDLADITYKMYFCSQPVNPSENSSSLIIPAPRIL